jgi:hypothetical protein
MSNLAVLLQKQKDEELEYEKLLQDLNTMHEIQNDLTSLLHTQRTSVEHIKDNISSIDNNVEIGLKDLKISRDLNTKYLPIIAGAIIGGIIGGPIIGLTSGLKIGGIIGVGTGFSIVGGGAGYVAQK